ncbi:MAG: ATP-binding cassette domain-containing protein [Candidatus Saccharimonadales bacterium]
MVEITSVSKRFGTITAVDSLGFEIDKGEVVGFVGVNGAGKSTTIAMMLGFISPSEGSIQLFGEKITPATAHVSHKRVGYAAGDMELFERLTGRQYIEFILASHGTRTTKRLDELSSLLQPQLEKKIGNLSRGNKQKIALIAAFVTNPDLVILDEPTSGLDPLMQQAFLQLIRQEREKGTTIFMSSHILSEVADVCSRVIVIANGKIVRDSDAAAYEKAGQKRVHVIAAKLLKAPKGALEVSSIIMPNKKHQLDFVFHGHVKGLQTWLGNVVQLDDFSITDHGLEDAVNDIYSKEDER